MSALLTRTTIVVPCYNEASRLDVQAFADVAGRDDRPRFLFVDDGSSDTTADMLIALRDDVPGAATVLTFGQNRGKAEAVRLGMLRAIEDGAAFVGYWDADLATPLDAIVPMAEVLAEDPQIDIVIGSRVKLLGYEIERRWKRHLAGRVFATFASWTLSVPVYDTQCGAKLFRVDERLRRALAEPFRSRWIFDVEILARYAAELGFDADGLGRRVVELPLARWSDVAGSKVRPKDLVVAAADLGWIAWAYRLRGR